MNNQLQKIFQESIPKNKIDNELYTKYDVKERSSQCRRHRRLDRSDPDRGRRRLQAGRREKGGRSR